MKVMDYMSHERLETELAPLIYQRVKAGHAPGCIMALFDSQGIFFETSAGTFGASTETPTIDTRYRIASCSKSFTAAAILVLRDQGRLSLDDPITHYVPEVNSALPDEEAVPTLRMLLSMRGGLVTDDPWADRQESLSSSEFRALLRQHLIYSALPGERYEYSNTGYALLGQVIETVSQQSYVDFVTQTLFQPLGLNDTTFNYEHVPADKMAIGYRSVNAIWQPLPLSSPGAYSAIGGVISTVADLAKWAAWLAVANNPIQSPQVAGSPYKHTSHGIKGDPQPKTSSHHLCERAEVLSLSSRREMQRIQTPIHTPIQTPVSADGKSHQGYGFGLIIESGKHNDWLIQHSGGYPGYSAHMRWSAQMGVGVVAFENATYSGAIFPAAEALEHVLDKLRAQCSNSDPAMVTSLPEAIMPLKDSLVDALVHWDVERLQRICTDNVALDIPYDEREAQWQNIRVESGALYPAAAVVRPLSLQYVGGLEVSTGFLIEIPAEVGYVLIKALLAPIQPYQFQGFAFKHVADEAIHANE